MKPHRAPPRARVPVQRRAPTRPRPGPRCPPRARPPTICSSWTTPSTASRRRSPAADVDDLRSRVHGPVYAAGDDGLAAEVATWNVAVQHTPAVAVGATCAADVAAAVSWAVAHDLQVAVQATGHGPVRNAAGSLMITTRRMQGVHIDPERRHRPRRRPASRWAEVMEAAAEYGLAGLCGSSSGVGVVGYTLGGGMGSLGRKYGFAADHVTAVEIVTADGALRRVDGGLRARAVLGRARRQGQLRHRHRAGVRAGAGRPRCSAAASSSPATTPPRCCTRFREWAPTLPEEVSTSIAILRIRRPRGAAAAAARADRRPPAVRLRRAATTPRPSGCSRR